MLVQFKNDSKSVNTNNIFILFYKMHYVTPRVPIIINIYLNIVLYIKISHML